MRRARFATVLTLTAFLSAVTAGPALASDGDGGTATRPQTTALRSSIDRAAAAAAQTSPFPRVPARPATPVRKQMMGGGGGGGGMMMMTLLVTAASLAGTYFLVKELRKSTDEAAKNAQ